MESVGTKKPNQFKGKMDGLTFVLLMAVMSAVFGSSTQFGFNTGVINNPKDVSELL